MIMIMISASLHRQAAVYDGNLFKTSLRPTV